MPYELCVSLRALDDDGKPASDGAYAATEITDTIVTSVLDHEVWERFLLPAWSAVKSIEIPKMDKDKNGTERLP